MSYITGEAYFCGHRFFVDERVLIPRSPIAEMIQNQMQPWIDMKKVSRVLEIGTGSGCIALSMAIEFPEIEVVASDISAPALEVARKNREDKNLVDKVELVHSDLFENISGTFDLIVTNPPYVPEEVMRDLPIEYSFEPRQALIAGNKGLDFISRILQDAPPFLNQKGILVVEAGVAAEELEKSEDLSFMWATFENGGDGVAVIEAQHLS
jgi:ribosomal protein L3 glutamine methyltransferase